MSKIYPNIKKMVVVVLQLLAKPRLGLDKVAVWAFS